MLIDSHCHLNYDGLVEDQANILRRARAAGVTGLLNIATRRSEWSDVLATADREPDVWATIGVHPHEADAHADLSVASLMEAASHSKVIGLGETGLDYHYDRSDRGVQQQLFRTHIQAARELDIPVVIHTRHAEEDTLRILGEEMRRGRFRGLVHCFTGSAEFARNALALGVYISFSGIVTFKNARDLQAVAAKMPEDRLLVETDSPFLAPVPNRGKVCEPAYVRDTCRFIAALRRVEEAQLQASTTANFFRLFTKAVA